MTGPQAKEIVDHWGERARRSQQAHYLVATRYSARQAALTLAIIVLTAFTGSTLLAALPTNNTQLKLALGGVSILAAALAGLDRSKRYLENAEKHRVAGAAWNGIVHTTEILGVQLPQEVPNIDAAVDALGKSIDAVTSSSPQIPERLFKRLNIDGTYIYDPRRRGFWQSVLG